MPVCKLNELDVDYEESGSGRPLVLLHGFPLHRGVWEDSAKILAGRFRVIVPDLRGFGRTISEKPFTMESLADDVHQLLAALGATPCVLGGLSMGGYVAQAFAKKYPADLAGLVLIDTKSAADTAEGKQGRNQMIELARSSGSAAIAEQMFPKMIAASSVGTGAAAKLRAIMESCPVKTIEHALAAMRDREDYTSLFARLPVPLLVVVGDQDAISPPEVARAIVAGAPKGKLAMIAGAGHMVPIEKPAAFAEAIMRWEA
jgi:pimeloyl-ACP methyl ester carboxylesterase